jgi:hypothetical protein
LGTPSRKETRGERVTERGARPSVWSILILWLATLALIGYLWATTDVAAFLAALAGAHLPVLVAAVVGFAWLGLGADILALRFLFATAGYEIGTRAVVRMRAVSYLWQTIHYGLGLAYMAAVLARHSRRGVAAAASPFFVFAVADIAAISAVLLLGLLLAHDQLPAGVPLPLLVAAAMGGILLLPTARVVATRPVVARLIGPHGQNLTAALQALTPVTFAKLLALRTATVGLYVLAEGAYLYAFGFTVPGLALLAFVPIILLVVALPIAVYGIGSSQIAMRVLFADLVPPATAVPDAAVDAYSTATILVIIGARLLLALVVALAIFERAPHAAASGAAPDRGGV